MWTKHHTKILWQSFLHYLFSDAETQSKTGSTSSFVQLQKEWLYWAVLSFFMFNERYTMQSLLFDSRMNDSCELILFSESKYTMQIV